MIDDDSDESDESDASDDEPIIVEQGPKTPAFSTGYLGLKELERLLKEAEKYTLRQPFSVPSASEARHVVVTPTRVLLSGVF